MIFRLVMVPGLGHILSIAAYAQTVDLSLEPIELTASTGEVIELQFWARSSSPIAMDGVEAVIAWDAEDITLEGNTNVNNGVWQSSGFPAESGYNATWNDGDALYQVVAPLSGDAPTTDLLITTLRFTVGLNPGETPVSILANGDTVVASAGADVLGSTGSSIIQVPASGGGGSTPPGGGGDDSGVDDSSDGTDPDGGQDDTQVDDSGGDQDGTLPDASDGEPDDATSDDGADNVDAAQDTDQPANESEPSDERLDSPIPGCGLGTAQGMFWTMAGLCLLQGSHLRRVAPRRSRHRGSCRAT
jgi:hypothetical protein